MLIEYEMFHLGELLLCVSFWRMDLDCSPSPTWLLFFIGVYRALQLNAYFVRTEEENIPRCLLFGKESE